MDGHFRAAAAAMVACGEYATYHAVNQAVCAIHGVGSLEQLGASAHHLPSASLLLHIENTVANYAAAFVASHGLCTLKDFELELVAALNCQRTPGMTVPNSDQAQPVNDPAFFADFGVGPLTRHPAVRAHWGWAAIDAYEPSVALGYVEVAQHLLQYLDEQHQLPSSSCAPSECDRVAADPASFGKFIEERTGYSLCKLGVMVIGHALPATIFALRHATGALADLHIRATKVALEQMQSRSEFGMLASAAARGSGGGTRRQQAPAEAGAKRGVRTPKLQPPTDAALVEVLARARTLLGPGYAPTRTAVHAAVAQMAEPTVSRPKHKKAPASRSRAADEAGNGGECNPQTVGSCVLGRDVLLSIATEYLMLHVGSSKWRSRRFDTAEISTTEEAAAQHEASSSSGSSSSSPSSSSSSSCSSSSCEGSDADEEQSGTGSAVVGPEAVGADTHLQGRVSKRKRGQRHSTASQGVAPASSSECKSAPSPAQPQASNAIADPNEISIDVPDELASPSKVADRTGSACASSGVAGVEVNVVEHARDQVARVPTRLATARGKATHTGAGNEVVGAALTAYGCVPWHGALAVSEDLDLSDPRAVGRWGEALVFSYLVCTLPRARQAVWLNQREEVKAPYDLTIAERGAAAHAGGGGAVPTVFIEVKTTRFEDNNVFDISLFELEFMREPHIRYTIYRVSGAGSASPRITIINDPLQAVKDGRVRLCMAI
jgi:hypothetical protein